MLKIKTLFVFSLFLGGSLLAQQNQLRDFIQIEKSSNFITYKSDNPITADNLTTIYKEELGLSKNDKLNKLKVEQDRLNFKHFRFQQVCNGVEVYGAQYLVHEKNQKVISSNGRLVSNISKATAILNKNSAIQAAISYLGASSYMWENAGAEQLLKKMKNDPFASYYPEAELVYFDKYFTQVGSNYKLAYKIEVYSEKPLAKQDVFVDAQTGGIIHSYNKIHTAEVTGSANTKYAGTQSIQTDSLSATSYRLREYARGGGIETYNMLEGTDYALAVDFIDTDNVWNNVNAQQDEAATDAHWAAEMTYDYFLNEHARNSFDNAGAKLLSYVHYDAAYANAFWDGTRMTYGDGDGTSNSALTSLDVGGHEIAHAVTEHTADLVYQNESGALNESFSDIFGTAIEFYADPANADWFIGEDFDLTGGNGFRDMADPNVKGDPDTYLGTNWEFTAVDNGGVHTNSGVQNYWFYLLSVGGAGTNDNGDAYSITGLGIDAAAAIAYRNLSVYLTQSSTYSEARDGAIQAAEDIYGACSNEVIETAKAWAAVGVGFAIEDNDLTLLKIESPATACGLTNVEDVTIVIRNNGCVADLLAGTTIPVSYKVNGGAVVNETITLGSTFAAGDTLTYTFTAKADLSTVGMHNVSSWVKFGLDNQALNDSVVGMSLEHKLQQNEDVAMVKILTPVSGCQLSNAESVKIAVQFLGCDSLAVGTNVDVAYQVNGGTIVTETIVLTSPLYAEDTVYYTFTNTADLSANGTFSIDTWTAFAIDNINGNDLISGYTVKNPYSISTGDIVTFENNTAVLDSVIFVDNIESDISVSNADAATGTYALRMTGGDPMASGISPDLDSVGFWTNNMEFAAYATFCVDATTWSVATLEFDLKQTMSKVYALQLGQAVPQASSLRVVVNGTQVGGTYNPVTETGDPFTAITINLDAYAGTQFELVFESRMGFSEAADPLSGFPFSSKGDNAYIDNITFSQTLVSIEEDKALENLSVYPNPNNGEFTVQFNTLNNQEVKLEVYNVLGELIVSENNAVTSGLNTLNVNIQEQTKGIYFVKVVSGENMFTTKVIKK